MIKKEISEIKNLFTQNNCSITQIGGCYVDGEKNKKALFRRAFLSLPEEEMFKYFAIFRKAISGPVGKNLHNLEFSGDSGTATVQKLLMELRDTKLKDDRKLEMFYDYIIEAYNYVGNYLILVMHDVYDIPGKTSDGLHMEDASDEIYEYILACICPVNLSKPGLGYNPDSGMFQNMEQEWVVGMPENAFLFPAFDERRENIQRILYYTKNQKDLHTELIKALCCRKSLTAPEQWETFQAVVKDVLGDSCTFNILKNVYEELDELTKGRNENADQLELGKKDVEALLYKSGAPDENMEEFGRHWEETAGENLKLLVGNVTEREIKVQAPGILVKVKPEYLDSVEKVNIEGKECLVIQLNGDFDLNGINVK